MFRKREQLQFQSEASLAAAAPRAATQEELQEQRETELKQLEAQLEDLESKCREFDLGTRTDQQTINDYLNQANKLNAEIESLKASNSRRQKVSFVLRFGC